MKSSHSDHSCCHGCTVTRQSHLQSKFDKKTVGEYFLFSLHGINVLLRFRFFTSVVDVIYLDYGQSECVPLNKLCSSTPGDIMSRRPMAQYVNLEGVHPVSQTTFVIQLNKRNCLY